MKVSFVTTILNEEETIGDLLDSLVNQSRKPDEIIIVDAGSTDKTVNIIKKHQAQNTLMIRIIRVVGVNRSQGRNLGIKSAKHQVIALSDAGCTLDEDWLERITQPLKVKINQSVAGFYLTQPKNIFQKSVAPFLAVMPDKFDPKTYLPSSRSLALRKSAWEKVGKYSENLDFCEDLDFAFKLKNQTQMIVRSDAIVIWRLPENFKSFFVSIKNYAYGDVRARFKPHIKKILTVFLRYLIFTGVPILFPIYLIWPTLKHFNHVKHPLALIYLPLLQLTTDLSIILGSLRALIFLALKNTREKLF